MKRTIKQTLAILMALILMVTALTACTGNNETQEPDIEKDGKTKVTVGLTKGFESMSPIHNYDTYMYLVVSHIYQVLAEAEENGSAEMTGVLMKEWVTEDDGFTYTCTLYDYIVDSAGNRFTANDVKFCIDKDIEEALEWAAYIESCEVVDDVTFILKMKSNAPGIFQQTVQILWMCTQAAYEASADGLATMPVGTGPYICTDFTADSSVTLEVNENYWQTDELNPAGYGHNVDVIEFNFLKEATQMSIALETDKAQLGLWVNMGILGELDGVDNVVVETQSHWSSKNFMFNMSEGSVFADNLALRQAVCYAVNGDAVMQAVTRGYGAVSRALGDATQIGYNTDWEKNGYYDYDVEKAKELLEEAGYKPGELSIRFLCINSDDEILAGQCLKADLAAIGIDVELVTPDTATYVNYTDASYGQYDIAAGNGQYGVYVTSLWANLFNRDKRASGNTWFGLHDDHLQEMYDLCTSAEGFTQENLDEFNKYVTDNAFVYQWYKSSAACVHSDKITLVHDWRNFIRVGSCEYSDEYNYFVA